MSAPGPLARHRRPDLDAHRAKRPHWRPLEVPLPQPVPQPPVLEPKYPIRKLRICSCCLIHFVACTRRWASRVMLNRCSRVWMSSASSSGVSKSKSNVPRPARLSVLATNWLRGLCRLLPLPCANSTSPSEFSGNRKVTRKRCAASENLHVNHT